MWENFVFLVIFDTCDVVYNWSISLLPPIVLDNLFEPNQIPTSYPYFPNQSLRESTKETTWRDTKIRWLKRNYMKRYKNPMIEKELHEEIQKSDDWKGTT